MIVLRENLNSRVKKVKVKVDGKIYESITMASLKLGFSMSSLRKWAKTHGKIPSTGQKLEMIEPEKARNVL